MPTIIAGLRNAGEDALHNVAVVAKEIPTFLIAVVIVLVAAWIAQVVGRMIDRAGKFSPQLDPSLKLLIRQLIVAGIITFGIAVAFGVLGVGFSTIIASFGVAGLIVGFALKDILENFVAGVLILWRRPFEISDQIQVGTNAGTVKEINFRNTALRTDDGIEVLIPNAQIFSQAIQNLTEGGSRRTTIVVTVANDANLASVATLLTNAVESVRGVQAAPAPEVLLLGSTPAEFQLHVRYWTAPEIQTASEIESVARVQIAQTLASGLAPDSSGSDRSSPGT